MSSFVNINPINKLAIIYNIFDGCELLAASLLSVSRAHLFIFVYQKISNYAEEYDPLPEIKRAIYNTIPGATLCIFSEYTPDISKPAFWNETKKRNIGLDIAKDHECTHFLQMDVDEVYFDFGNAVQQYQCSVHEGSVCKMYTYFKLPTLRFEHFDNYYVPFIHKLRTDTVTGAPDYPFYVDPTRRINCQDVALIDEPMHHFSYVRKDIERKCRNSSARANIERSQLLQDYNDPLLRAGFFVKDFQQKLIEVENIFNIVV